MNKIQIAQNITLRIITGWRHEPATFTFRNRNIANQTPSQTACITASSAATTHSSLSHTANNQSLTQEQTTYDNNNSHATSHNTNVFDTTE